MTRPKLLSAMLTCGLALSMSGAAQERGSWRAASTTARSITGDVAFSNEKISINFASFPIAQIRDLNAPELAAAFIAAANASGSGNLYRLSIPAAKLFLHHNTLCGSEDTQWIATYVEGRSLQLAFFSGPQMPVFTPDALANGTNLCGTYTYVR